MVTVNRRAPYASSQFAGFLGRSQRITIFNKFQMKMSKRHQIMTAGVFFFFKIFVEILCLVMLMQRNKDRCKYQKVCVCMSFVLLMSKTNQ